MKGKTKFQVSILLSVPWRVNSLTKILNIILLNNRFSFIFIYPNYDFRCQFPFSLFLLISTIFPYFFLFVFSTTFLLSLFISSSCFLQAKFLTLPVNLRYFCTFVESFYQLKIFTYVYHIQEWRSISPSLSLSPKNICIYTSQIIISLVSFSFDYISMLFPYLNGSTSVDSLSFLLIFYLLCIPSAVSSQAFSRLFCSTLKSAWYYCKLVTQKYVRTCGVIAFIWSV